MVCFGTKLQLGILIHLSVLIGILVGRQVGFEPTTYANRVYHLQSLSVVNTYCLHYYALFDMQPKHYCSFDKAVCIVYSADLWLWLSV